MAGAPGGATLAPPLASSSRLLGHHDYVINVLLNGLTGPLDGTSYSGGVMVQMGANSDEWIADVASYVRTSFGNRGTLVNVEQVASARKTYGRKKPWTLGELEAAIPMPLTNVAAWKFSASHNEAAAANVASNGREHWDTGAAQQPGMWFQTELPEPARINEIRLDAGPGRRGPIGYTIELSMDGTTWGPPNASGAGQTPVTVASFAPAQARFIRVTQTGSGGPEPWTIQQILVYGRTGH